MTKYFSWIKLNESKSIVLKLLRPHKVKYNIVIINDYRTKRQKVTNITVFQGLVVTLMMMVVVSIQLSLCCSQCIEPCKARGERQSKGTKQPPPTQMAKSIRDCFWNVTSALIPQVRLPPFEMACGRSCGRRDLSHRLERPGRCSELQDRHQHPRHCCRYLTVASIFIVHDKEKTDFLARKLFVVMLVR